MAQAGSERPTVLVTAAPYMWVLKRLEPELIQATLLVPAGASLHTHEPSPRQAINAADARLWLQVGEPVELRVQGLRPDLRKLNLQEGIELLGGQHHGHGHDREHQHGEYDPHTWMSPQIMMRQSERIAEALIELIPEQKAAIEARLKTLLDDLERLHEQIQQRLADKKNKLVLVSHPALAYFCRSYGLAQLSIEQEGKDPTAMQLARILDEARQAKVRRILVVEQHSQRGAELLAEQLGAELVLVNPLSEDYPAMLQSILEAIAND